MLKMKNAALATAVLLALAACGGSSPDDADPGLDNGTPVIPGTGPGTDPDPDPGTDPGTDPAPADDTFAGSIVMRSNQVLFNGGDYVNAQDYAVFSTTGVYAQESRAAGASTPLSTFGMRVDQIGMNGQSGTIRVAVEFDNTASDELFQFLVEGATLTINETGRMSIASPDTARAYVVVNNGSGASANVTVAEVPADAVTVSTRPVHDHDPSSFALLVNLDAIMQAAIAAATDADRAVLAGASNANASGRYTLRMGLTGITLENDSGNAITLESPITVGSRAPLGGAGVSGVLYHNVEYP
ncbi:MAG TPA: hypothetical protein VM406_06070 [Noviherbaspirillum sp.]|nr:hypothetical protein [Noviherbaspirillum sp.]